jgi:hypothetical protein
MKTGPKNSDEKRVGMQISAELLRRVRVIVEMRGIEQRVATQEAFEDWVAKHITHYPNVAAALQQIAQPGKVAAARRAGGKS